MPLDGRTGSVRSASTRPLQTVLRRCGAVPVVPTAARGTAALLGPSITSADCRDPARLSRQPRLAFCRTVRVSRHCGLHALHCAAGARPPARLPTGNPHLRRVAAAAAARRVPAGDRLLQRDAYRDRCAVARADARPDFQAIATTLDSADPATVCGSIGKADGDSDARPHTRPVVDAHRKPIEGSDGSPHVLSLVARGV